MTAQRYRVTSIPPGVTLRAGGAVVEVGDVLPEGCAIETTQTIQGAWAPAANIGCAVLDIVEGARVTVPTILPHVLRGPYPEAGAREPAAELPPLTDDQIAKMGARLILHGKTVMDETCTAIHDTRDDARRLLAEVRRLHGLVARAATEIESMSEVGYPEILSELRGVAGEREP